MNRSPSAASRPLISVIALCYNHAPFLKETLDSIQAQTYAPIQLIIVDDGSCDQSRDLITRWASKTDLDHELVFNERNLGICGSLNRALSRAKGEYVAIVATDDVWFPQKLAVQVARIETLPHVGVVYSDAAVIDEGGAHVSESLIRSWGFAEAPEGDLFIQFLEKNPVPAPTALIRKSCFDAVGDYDESLSFEDLDMWLRIAGHYHFAYIDEVLALYREVTTSLSRQRNTKFLESTVRIHLKWLGKGEASDSILRRTIPEMVWRLYRHGDRHVSGYVGPSFRLAPSLRTLAAYLFVRVGIRHAHLRSVKRVIGRLLPK